MLSYFVSQIRACCVSHVSHSVSQNEGLLRRVGWTRDKRQATATASGKLPHTRPSICISLYLCPTPTPGWQATMFVYVTCACISACKFIRVHTRAEWVVWCQTYIVEAGSNVTFDVMPLNMLRSHASPTTLPRLMSFLNLLLKYYVLLSIGTLNRKTNRTLERKTGNLFDYCRGKGQAKVHGLNQVDLEAGCSATDPSRSTVHFLEPGSHSVIKPSC